jgi:DNA-binding NarL/FixJ family response regulator
MGRVLGNDLPLHGATILLAEDKVPIAFDLESILPDAGVQVLGPCSTLKSALKAATEGEASIAVLDVRLGRKTTYHVAEVLAERCVPFLSIPDKVCRTRSDPSPSMRDPYEARRPETADR